MVLSILEPHDELNYPGTCGYCSPPGERSAERTMFKAASATAIQLSCDVYQRMIDRGWRRSGTYCYKNDLKRSCCPHYTIKLDVAHFQPSKAHRKLLSRWNRFIIGDAADTPHTKVHGRPSKNEPFSLIKTIHDSEYQQLTTSASHKFEVELELASFTQEKFSLYCKYQAVIHNDLDKETSGFKSFLVHTPLKLETIPYPSSDPPAHLPKKYGSYHQLYRCDGELIAVAVLDILPKCISSVYFMYDPEWSKHSMGKMSALREASLALEMQAAGAPGMEALYMGFYIHSCQKMRYKGDYSPSYLVDPETYEWYPLQECIPLMEENRYACFSEPGHSLNTATDSRQKVSYPNKPEDSLSKDINIIKNASKGKVTTVSLSDTGILDDDVIICGGLITTIDGLGEDLSREVVFYM